ncbi:MarR family winged helix-turn-helix transcriptional regulator [uncultured Cetobacterium sp.]|uniref:MarR family winged helix-turn-helix transcriptional regulator n=1 Tax=uncultured Cetobacterium sp. TaxID=527638 RepID=UPI0026309F07|nr:MarR family winged helix-turn-helix transcriptional regulator [uncultured Cetobacterium sp.]
MNNLKTPILISRISKLQRIYLNKRLKPFNLDGTQGVILFNIKEKNKVTSKELVEMGIIEKASVSKTLTKLTNLGYIFKNPSSTDGRSFLITLTNKGEHIAKEVNNVAEELDSIFKEILSVSSLNEINTLFSHLEKIIK